MRAIIVFAVALAVANAASGSHGGATDPVQHDGNSEGDAANACEDASPDLLPGTEAHGTLIPVDDEADYYRLVIPPEYLNTRMLVEVVSDAFEVRMDVLLADCSRSIVPPEGDDHGHKHNGKGLGHTKCKGQGHELECSGEEAERDGNSITFNATKESYVLAVTLEQGAEPSGSFAVPLTCHEACWGPVERVIGYGKVFDSASA